MTRSLTKTERELLKTILACRDRAIKEKRRLTFRELAPFFRALAKEYPPANEIDPRIAMAVRLLQEAEDDVAPIRFRNPTEPRFRLLFGGKKRLRPR